MDIKVFSNESLASPMPLLPGQLHIFILPHSDGHVVLKQLLSAYLNCPKDSLLFQKGPHGKPALDMKNAQNIYFNLSHSGDYLALAFSRDSEVGIDIEKLHPIKNRQLIANRFFHPEEARHLYLHNRNDAEDLFFLYWTMKEAFVKGLGTGLSLPINSFCIEPAPVNEKDIYHITKSQMDYSAWRIQTIPAPDRYKCSVSYQLS